MTINTKTINVNNTDYNVIEVTKIIENVPVKCTIILDNTIDDFDVIASYQGEYDIDVVTEVINKH